MRMDDVFTSAEEAIAWISDQLAITLDAARWIYENTECPDWTDPGFREYPFLLDPRLPDLPEDL